MNRFYAHAQAGEPDVYLNDHDRSNPFAVVRFGDDWDFTTRDPQWCRRVATTWTRAAELLEGQRAADTGGQSQPTAIEHDRDPERQAE